MYNTDELYRFMVIDIEINRNDCRYCKRMFYLALKINNFSAMRFLLNEGIDPNFYDEYYRTPIHYAIENSNIEAAKLLLDYKADPNVVDDELEYSIVSAIRDDKIEMARLLVEYGADTTIVNDFDFLHHAVKVKNRDMVRFLIDIGADVIMTDAEGYTPLHYAMESTDCSEISYLFEYILSTKNYTLCEEMISIILSNYYNYDNVGVQLIISYFVLIEYLETASVSREIHKRNKELIDEIASLDDLRRQCETELRLMANTNLNNTFTVLDVCMYNRALSSNDLARYVKKLRILCNTTIRIYRIHIDPVIEIGSKRLTLLNSAIRAINKSNQHACQKVLSHWLMLPFELKYMIMEYITDEDLITLLS